MTSQNKELNKGVKSIDEHLETGSISPEVNQVIKGLRPDQQEVIIKAIKQEAFSGPIPHPELLQKYDEVKEGFAERIVKMAEIQLQHRVRCEEKIVDESIAESKRAQNYAFYLSILFLVAAVSLGLYGHDWLAGCLGGGTLISLVAAFIAGKKNKD
ncbi:MAG: DUF2335 domain-containing protein [Bacteroidaceae bacterium]|nr:DUF2335 domain-containing protein [Bacteroidaceae bacterium]